MFMKFFPCVVSLQVLGGLSCAGLILEREKGVSRIRSRLSESAHLASDDSEKFLKILLQ